MTTHARCLRETRDVIENMEPVDAAVIWADLGLWDEIGPKLTCTEAEALGALMLYAGASIDHVAKLVVELHGQGDRADEFDRHVT